MIDDRDQAIERDRWHPIALFEKRLDEILARVDSATYFNRADMQWLRDAWIAGQFAHHIEASHILLSRRGVWPDFKIRLTDGEVLQCEATEAMEEGRKRGAEYADWKRNGYRVRRVAQEIMEGRRAFAPSALRRFAKFRRVRLGSSRHRVAGTSRRLG
jgi:hypothetical protein